MLPTQNGSVRLFRFAGIDVWLHWSWVFALVYILQYRADGYDDPLWALAECLALFGIVLLHEFGHALACRQVGGFANRIVMWPLGGVAYVAPPPRAGPQLWSVVAGPLVNVALIPVFMFVPELLIKTGAAPDAGDFWLWVARMEQINIVLLIFNMMPVYPLDGGQTLRCLLWFVIGERKSLLVASVFGLVGAAGFAVLALMNFQIFLGLIAVLLGKTSWDSFQAAKRGGD